MKLAMPSSPGVITWTLHYTPTDSAGNALTANIHGITLQQASIPSRAGVGGLHAFEVKSALDGTPCVYDGKLIKMKPDLTVRISLELVMSEY